MIGGNMHDTCGENKEAHPSIHHKNNKNTSQLRQRKQKMTKNCSIRFSLRKIHRWCYQFITIVYS